MKELKKIAKRYYFKHILICVLVQMMLFYAPFPNLMAKPNPAPGTLPTGLIDRTGVNPPEVSGSNMSITQTVNQAIMNWRNFDIGAGATVTFNQGSSSAYVLNRVNACDGKATGINGNLIANGGVIVINPRGIVMGPSALINAGKFIASGLGISDKDFRDFATGAISILKFDADCTAGDVTNSGMINGDKAVYLVGNNVTNTGTISCPGGMIVMAAGEKVYLAQAGSDIVVEKLDTGSNAGDHKVTSGGIINATGAGILLAAGDIYSQAVITDARSFVAKANRNLNVNGALDVTGDVTLFADYDHVLPGDFHSTAQISAGGNIDVRGNDILLEDTVHAGGNLTIKGRDCYDTPEYPWGNVHAMKTLDADGDITISVTGEKQEQRWVSEGRCGGGQWEYYTTPQPGTIWLDDDVTAGGNLSLYNNTYTGAGVTLRAGDYIVLASDGLETTPPGFCDWLTGDTWLALRAGIEIVAPKTVISVIGSTLIMEQGLSLNLDNYLFANQANTNLTLISNQGSVTAVEMGAKPENAADKWNSIGATAYEDITLSGSGNIRSGESGTDLAKSLWAKNGNIDVRAGQDFSANKDIEAGSNIAATAGNNILLMGNATAGQNINLSAVADVEAQGNLTAGQDVTISSSDNTTYLGGNVTAGNNVVLNNNTQLNGAGNQLITAQNGTVLTNGTIAKINEGRMSILAADGITLTDAAEAQGSMLLDADTDKDGIGDMLAQSTLTTTTGDIEISASDTTIKLQGNVSAGRDLILNNNTEVAASKELKAGQNVSLACGKTITSFGDLTVNAGRNIGLGGDVTAGQDLILVSGVDTEAQGNLTATSGNITASAGNNLLLKGNATAGQNITLTAGADVETQGNLIVGQDVTISSSDNTTYIGGDVYAGHDILLNNNTKVNGLNGDQTLEAGNKLTASGYVRKVTPGDMYLKGNSDGLSIDLQYNNEGPGTSTSQGNLWILGQGDIQISGDVTTFGPSEYISIQSEIAVARSTGGVAIISNEGKIYTHTEGGNDDTLNISVTGNSDHFNNTGVYGFGLHTDQGDIEPTILAEADNTEAKAAIAIVSAKELKIGENGKLTAYGTYYDNVDDRSAIGFLDTEAQIPDGTSRNPGVPFDLAIYTASRDSSVTVKGPVTIESEPIIVPTIEKIFVTEQEHVAKGAMVIDAYDIVTLGDKFMQSLANGDIGNRLEVCSRITEWLEDAVGRLPFLDSSDLPQGYSYVMRGAGLENPGITDGRAWVLESKEKPIPPIPPIEPFTVEPFTAAAPIQQPELTFTGCPAVMNWVAKELGVEKDQIQIYVAGAMAMSSSVQPCDSCARLKNTALVLMDADGAQVKALGDIVNEFTAAGAPPSEEQMAMIAASLKNPEDGTRYALAAQWLNALAEYINILHSDLNLPIDETMAFAAKYTSPVTGGDNAALAAYVQARMDTLGG